MDNPRWLLFWRIATSSALLAKGNFFALGLPPPSTPDFKPYSQILPQSLGGQAQQGYQNITLLWDSMDFEQIKTLSDIVDTAITAGIIYATIDRAHGAKLLNDFIDVSGVPGILDYQTVSNGRGVVAANVTLKINNLTIINDPSNVPGL